MATVIRQPNIYKERVVEEPVAYSQSARASYKVSSVIYYILDVLEVLLAARLVFRLFGAISASPFVNFIYRITRPLVAPFTGIFRNSSFASGVVEWSTIIAMVVFAVIAFAIVDLIYRFRRTA